MLEMLRNVQHHGRRIHTDDRCRTGRDPARRIRDTRSTSDVDDAIARGD